MDEPFESIVPGGLFRYMTPITQDDLNPFYPEEVGMFTRLSRDVEIGDIIKELSNDEMGRLFYGELIDRTPLLFPRRWILSHFDHVEKTESRSESSLGGKKTRRRRRKTKRRKHKKRYSRKYKK
jgi:hypothetical protein